MIHVEASHDAALGGEFLETTSGDLDAEHPDVVRDGQEQR